MSDRPSDGMDIDELRDEFDWITEFQSRMAERIRGDADVHNLVDYVGKLEAENSKLRDELDFCLKYVPKCDECAAMLDCDECLRADSSQKERKRLDYENAKLRELVRDMEAEIRGLGVDFKRVGWCDYADRMRELGVDA